ncbi:hypothetical protein [Sphingomonas sp. S-NIH.Pt15_0812]|uniref:hypothetical protein n=1 Tax=Sphingomonas sp. S-NIH.Pt15_0812 TaxID=1920129 RepID=UPI000F7F1277|nr:hypothetical protein [Sphingomonas sp. S-NIH.Pt15_0812]
MGTVFAVLRRAYAGRTNSALEFGYRKAHLGAVLASADTTVWSPNVERIEVLLPAGADDSLADPATLLGQMDAHAVEREKALLTYLTLPLGDVDRVHIGWERARAFLRERFARDRDLASVLILHAPGTINAAFPLHAHALIVPRRVTGLGIRQGLYDEDMIHDRGQAIIETMWADHLASFR